MNVRSRKPYDSLPSAEKHVAKLIERSTKREGERVLAEKVMERVDWGEFSMKEIRDAKDKLIDEKLIEEDGLFLVRLWN